jgi:CBS domain containing-hemolysin-like protein
MPKDSEIATVGGLLSEQLGRLPTNGDSLDWNGYRFTVLSASQSGAELVSIVEII